VDRGGKTPRVSPVCGIVWCVRVICAWRMMAGGTEMMMWGGCWRVKMRWTFVGGSRATYPWPCACDVSARRMCRAVEEVDPPRDGERAENASPYRRLASRVPLELEHQSFLRVGVEDGRGSGGVVAVFTAVLRRAASKRGAVHGFWWRDTVRSRVCEGVCGGGCGRCQLYSLFCFPRFEWKRADTREVPPEWLAPRSCPIEFSRVDVVSTPVGTVTAYCEHDAQYKRVVGASLRRRFV